MAQRLGRKPKKDPTIVEHKYLCPYCNKEKKPDLFYTNTDPMMKTGRTVMCKDCARKIARNYNPKTKQYGDCTKASIQNALERLDKPYFESLYETSYNELNSPDSMRIRTSLWDCYIKNVGMKQYDGYRWRDGDIYDSYRQKAMNEAGIQDNSVKIEKSENVISEEQLREQADLYDIYQKNKSDVLRLLEYDPFEDENEEDKPLLYSQLLGYLDLGGDNEDMMRTSSAITIVRGFLQQAKIDNMLAKAMENISADGKAGEIKSLLDSKQKISSTISTLAEQSCLSLKHNKNASKGENTWTGKIKKIKELNLREGEVNGFDIATCRGMRQVMDMSNESILKALNMDESEWSEVVANQRTMIDKLIRERDGYQEINRILLRENIDLKDTLEENDIILDDDCVDLNELYSPFKDMEQSDSEDEDDSDVEELEDDDDDYMDDGGDIDA